MAKRWCGFFALAPVVVASLALAQEQKPADDFMSLPGHDLEPIVEIEGAVRIGDAVDMKVSGFDAKPGLQFREPPGDEPLFDQGWLVRWDDERKVLKVSPLQAGQKTLPSLLILDAGGLRVARTHPFTLKAEGGNDPNAQAEPPLPPIQLPFPKWIAILGGVVGALALGALIWALIRWSRKARPRPPLPQTPERIISADERALQALKDLVSEGWIGKGKPKPHYFGVSEILRRYLGSALGFDAIDMTTREVVHSLESQKAIEDSKIDQIEKLLEMLDVVKFTDQLPSAEEAQQVVNDARQIVLALKREARVDRSANAL